MDKAVQVFLRITRTNENGVLTGDGGDDVGPEEGRNRSTKVMESGAFADRVGGASLWSAL